MSEILLPTPVVDEGGGYQARRIIVLSGPVSAGKTTLAETLRTKYRMEWFKTRDVIGDPNVERQERRALQRAGAARDRRTGGRWVVDALMRHLARHDAPDRRVHDVIVDAVRTRPQVDAIREAFGARVTHVHLMAPLGVLSARYEERRLGSGRTAVRELASYAEVHADAVERRVKQLENIADVVIDTARNSADDVVVRVASALGLYGRTLERLVDVVVGAAYGGEGKGHIASYLAPEYGLLVRGGGPDAGHTVFERPVPYTFHHLPSGTRKSSAMLALGPGAVLWVDALLAEIADCDVDRTRLAIDPNAMIVAPQDRVSQRRLAARDSELDAATVGTAAARRVLRRAAKPTVRLAQHVPALRPYLRDMQDVLEDAFRNGRRVLLEGTQGTGLSLYHARSYPHVAPRDTSVSGCLSEVGIPPHRVRRTVMVCRPYTVYAPVNREGVSGLTWEEVSTRSRVPLDELLETVPPQRGSTTARRQRVAEFDWTLLRRSATVNGPTDVALCFTDHISLDNQRAFRFEQLTGHTIRFIEEIERVASAPVSLISTRFHARSIIDRRSW